MPLRAYSIVPTPRRRSAGGARSPQSTPPRTMNFPGGSLLILAVLATPLATQATDWNGEGEIVGIKRLYLDGYKGLFTLSPERPGAFSAQLEEQSELQLHRVPGYLPRWKSDHSLALSVERRLRDEFSLRLSGRAAEFRDQSLRRRPDSAPLQPSPPRENEVTPPPAEPSMFEQSLQNSSFAAGGRWILPGGGINAAVGLQSDNRGASRRTGFLEEASLQYARGSVAASATGWMAQMPGGVDHHLSAFFGATYLPGDEAEERLTLEFLSGRRLDPGYEGGITTHREDRSVRLGNRLAVKMVESIGVEWVSDLTSRSARRLTGETERRDVEFDWKNGVAASWEWRDYSLGLSGDADVQQLNYAGGLTEGIRNALGLSLGRYRDRDSLSFRAGVVKYRYDTPDESDYNDRDELRYKGELAGGVSLTPTFGLAAAVAFDLMHFVYISSARSGENRWTRRFSIQTAAPWRERLFDNRARFGVTAHYTEFDFSPFDLSASRAFRSFTASDTLLLHFGVHWFGELSMAGELSDHGSLDWGNWRQSVTEEGSSFTIGLMPGFERGNLQGAAGWIVHRRVITPREESGGFQTRVDYSGPNVRLSYRPDEKSAFEARGTSLKVRDRERGDFTIPDLEIKYRWSF